MTEEIKEGSIIKGPFWPESVKVDRVGKLGNYIRVIGSTINSKRHIDQLLKPSDIDGITILTRIIDFSTPSEKVFLAIEGARFKYASLFDPLLAMNVSKIDPLPFQIEAVYGYVLRQPRIRFLIADDPGAGKTIMAGLVIKELKLRRIAKRILIVVPGHLKDQWRRELKEKFSETFTLLSNRSTLDSYYGENPWEKNSQVITSIDFAKQDDIMPSLSAAHWDLVVVDEAHKMAAYKYGDKTSKTGRYKLGEVLSNTSSHLLFLTATPHKGDPENFRLFLDLLVPGFFATNKMVEESLNNKDNPLFIRRLKEDLKNFNGEPIFKKRFPKTLKFKLSDNEQTLYNDVSRYVIEQYNTLRKDKKRNVAFALMILQRRIASSMYALLRSLKRRKDKLEKILKGDEERPKNINTDIEVIEDMEEEERWKREEEWESVTAAKNPEELRIEIEKLDELISQAKEIIKNEEETKLKELRKAIESTEKNADSLKDAKMLIFTESKDTLEYLVDKISKWGYSVNYIHGGMKMEDRIKAEKTFRDETQIMVATEAAGEGINLQFCHIMVNYDIPWNPNRLEQRMGRIHRYGQQKDVYIYNLVAESTREGKVLARIFDKLDEIKNKLGSDKVFDVIGDVFYGKDLYQLIIDAVTNSRNIEDILKDVDIKPDEAYIIKIKDALGESLATKFIDYTRIKDITEKAKENRLIPEYVEEYFKKAFTKLGGKFRELKSGFMAIDSIPYEVKQIAESENFKNRFGTMMKRYPKVTFDKDIAFKNPDAEFISFGHPLLEAVLQLIKTRFEEEAKRGAVFKDPSGVYSGFVWFYIGEVKDGKGESAGKKIMAVYDNGKELKEISPTILWDLAPSNSNDLVQINGEKENVQSFVIESVEKYKSEIKKERERQANIKTKYGIASLQYLIRELDTDLAGLYERQANGENVDLAIRNKEEQKKRYEESLEMLKVEIERETSLSITNPELLTVIRVIPGNGGMARDEEVEQIGMEISMEYEKSQGREPKDISKENLGFDIKSKGNNEVRYIEVKARAAGGIVELTINEWLKAKMLKDQYWLYIVENAKTHPVLRIINNPAYNLKAEEKVEIVRFIVKQEEWKNKSKVVRWN